MGDFELGNAKTLHAPVLRRINGSFSAYFGQMILNLSLPSLEIVEGDLRIEYVLYDVMSNFSMTLALDSLETVGGAVSLRAENGADFISLFLDALQESVTSLGSLEILSSEGYGGSGGPQWLLCQSAKDHFAAITPGESDLNYYGNAVVVEDC
jgi:hypothetical protein